MLKNRELLIMLILGEHLLTWEGLERGVGFKMAPKNQENVNNVHYASILGEPLLTWDGVKGGEWCSKPGKCC